MKLAKLLVLVPAFAMVACGGKGGNTSSEEPKPVTEVTAAVFNAQINGGQYLKPGYNKTMVAQFGEEQYVLEQDGSKYHGEIEGDECFIEVTEYHKDEDNYDIDIYWEGASDWEKYEETGVTTAELARSALQWIPAALDFKTFTYKEDEGVYFADSFVLEIYDEEYTFKNTTIKFEDGVFQELVTTMEQDGESGVLSYKTTKVGETTVTLPEVE